ncbi:hypothetical protein AB0I54_46765 [Streptomyces sp. NPDC050625]
MTRRQLTHEQWKLIEPFLPIGEYGPYPERLQGYPPSWLVLHVGFVPE